MPLKSAADNDIRIDARGGSGCYGAVWKGRQLSLKRDVAIKIIHPSMAQYIDLIEHAQGLVRAGGHPNVVSVYAVTTLAHPESNELVDAVIMEWLEGERLDNRLGRTLFAPAEAQCICDGLLSGVEHLHRAGVSHGDLHEGNVMITAEGVRLIDIDYSHEKSLRILSTLGRDGRIAQDVRQLSFLIAQIVQNTSLALSRIEEPVRKLRCSRSLGEVRELVQHAFQTSLAEHSVPSPAQDNSIQPGETIETTIERSRALLRTNDLVGWKELLRNTRKQVYGQLPQWRREADKRISQSGEKLPADWNDIAANGLATVAPLLVLALSAIDSEHSQLRSQTGFVDDLLHMTDWNYAGYNVTADATYAFTTVGHHVIGAAMLAARQHESALALLRINVPPDHNSSRTEQLWSCSNLMGWSDMFGGSISKTWDFINSLWTIAPWLQHYFVREREFHIHLRGYILLAALLELSRIAQDSTALQRLDADKGSVGSVPPMSFLQPPKSYSLLPMQQIMDSAAPSRDVLNSLLKIYGAPEKAFRHAWAKYYGGQIDLFHRIYQHRRPLDREALEVPRLP